VKIMSDLENPYQSPETPIVPETSQDSGVSLSVTMLQYLFEASPWLRFVGIIGYIGSGLSCVGGIISTIVTFSVGNITGDLGMFSPWILPLVYIPVGILLFFPSHFTYKFGQKIRSYHYSHFRDDLETAFKYNRSLWKFNGILYIVYLASIPVLIVIMLVVGIVSTFNVL
jgi:hypothetical protein